MLFAVKTLYRTTATGRPKRRDEHYDRDTVLIEERVVLFRASTFDSAIKKAEREARKYAAGDCGHNGYGQALATEYLECCDAYETCLERPDEEVEIYSQTEVVSKRRSVESIEKQRLGRLHGSSEWKARVKFVDADPL